MRVTNSTAKKPLKEVGFQSIIERLSSFSLPSVDLVVGIAEGGVVPASLVAWKLGCALCVVKIQYRNKDNVPKYKDLRVFSSGVRSGKRVLIVDDVSVTGKTLREARKLFPKSVITTFVLKGSADYVLFPEVSGCVQWPWKIEE